MSLLGTLTLSLALSAAADLTAEDFRIYCGWQGEIAKDENKSLAKDKQLAKVAKLAKVSPKDLKKIVAKGDGAGGSCEAIAKDHESRARKALEGTPLAARVESLQLDFDDPTHVVAYVKWKGEQEKRLEEEASLIAWAVGSNAPIVRTLSIRAVDPKDGETALLEGKISAEQMTKIDKARIDSFADARYMKLFDGVIFANPHLHQASLK
ncbi:MAG: hypothetical protein AB2A00_36955 [Myxococcota bacterium]